MSIGKEWQEYGEDMGAPYSTASGNGLLCFLGRCDYSGELCGIFYLYEAVFYPLSRQ